MSIEGWNNSDTADIQSNQPNLNESMNNQENLIIDFSDISEKLSPLIPDELQDDFSYLEDAFDMLEEDQKQELLNDLKEPEYLWAIAEVFILNITEELEIIIYEIWNLKEKVEWEKEKVEGEKEKVEGEKEKVENNNLQEEKSQEFNELNNEIINSISEEFDALKKSPEWIFILNQARIQLEKANPSLNPDQIDTYAETYLLLEYKDKFLEGKPDLKDDFEALDKAMKDSPIFENIAIPEIIRDSDIQITDNQIKSIVWTNTAQWWKIKFDGNIITVWDQEYVEGDNGKMTKSIVSENGNYKLPTAIEYKTDYFLLAETRKQNKLLKEIDSQMDTLNVDLWMLQSMLAEEKNNLSTENDPDLKEGIQRDIDALQSKINIIELELISLESQKNECIARINDLKEEERLWYRDSLNEQTKQDDKRREVLKFIKQIWLDVIDQSDLELILREVSWTEIDMWITGLDEWNIDLANGIFWQREGLWMDVMKGNLLMFFNRIISWNEKEPLILSQYNGAVSEKTEERKDIVNMLKNNDIINGTWNINIETIRANLRWLDKQEETIKK